MTERLHSHRGNFARATALSIIVMGALPAPKPKPIRRPALLGPIGPRAGADSDECERAALGSHRRLVVNHFALSSAFDGYTQAQAAGPDAAGVLRAAAIFQHFQRAHAQAAAEIGGLADGSDNNAGLGQRGFALRQILADVLWELRRIRRRPAAGGLSAAPP